MKRVLFRGLIIMLLPLTVLPGAALSDLGSVAPSTPGPDGVQTTWQVSTVDSTGSIGRYADVAVDGANHPHIAYYDESNGNLKYAHHNGAFWAIQTIDSAGTVGQYPAIAIDSAGRPGIVYWGEGNIKYARWTGSAWAIEVATVGGWASHFHSLTLDSLDRPHIAFYDTNSGGLWYAHYDGSWHRTQVEGGLVGMYPAIDLQPSGHPGISYCQYNASWQCELVKYAHYNGSSWQIEPVEGGGQVGSYTSLAIDSAGRPHISYHQSSLFNLHYAYKDGGGWHVETVDSDGDVGTYTSLQLDSNDRPHIGYYGWSWSNSISQPKYAYHDGAAWTIETVESAEEMGLYTSLALDSADRPHMAYYDKANENLKYAVGECTPVTGVSIGGPHYLTIGETGAYTASPIPASATAPIQYAWGGGGDGPTRTCQWHTPGTYTIVVNATNACGWAQGTLDVLVTRQPSRFGINQYLTNANHNDDQVNTLIPLSQAIGPRWSREEIIWANYDTPWGQAFFDRRIQQEFLAGFHIIGNIVTTPEHYSTQECKDWAQQNGYPWWNCPPANASEFAAFCGEVVERYDGDGYLDAPGSPRIGVWEVWNEPDTMGTFLPAPDPALYTGMLCQCYQAIKAADPTAKVLFGGVGGFETVGRDGFVDAVVAYGGWPCFDVLSYHVYQSPYPPEQLNPGQPEPIDWSMVAVMTMVSDWLAAHGGGKELWMTEIGWSTAAGHNTEDEQANYMVRAHGLIFYHGWQHIDYFQLHDHGGGMGPPYAEMAIVHPGFTPKKAYFAYGFMTTMLGNAEYVGPGWLHNVQYLASDVYDLRFRRPDGTWVDLLWQPQGQTTYLFRVEPGVEQVTWYNRDGTFSQVLTPVDGLVEVTLSGQPCYLGRKPTGPVYGVFLALVRR